MEIPCCGSDSEAYQAILDDFARVQDTQELRLIMSEMPKLREFYTEIKRRVENARREEWRSEWERERSENESVNDLDVEEEELLTVL